jgi:hypothetical protein
MHRSGVENRKGDEIARYYFFLQPVCAALPACQRGQAMSRPKKQGL